MNTAFCSHIRLASTVLPQNKHIYLFDHHTIINNSYFPVLFKCLLKTSQLAKQRREQKHIFKSKNCNIKKKK